MIKVGLTLSVFIMSNGGTVNFHFIGNLLLCKLLLKSCGSEFFGKTHFIFPHKIKSAQPKPRTKNANRNAVV